MRQRADESRRKTPELGIAARSAGAWDIRRMGPSKTRSKVNPAPSLWPTGTCFIFTKWSTEPSSSITFSVKHGRTCETRMDGLERAGARGLWWRCVIPHRHSACCLHRADRLHEGFQWSIGARTGCDL